MIRLYRALWFIVSPLLLIWLIYRICKGKESLNRISERFGFARIDSLRSNVIWIHAASVGESMMALNIAHKLSLLHPNYILLITTGTTTSAKLVEKRKPNNAVHQFIPLDEYFCVKRFFEFWKPSLGITLESEIWPNLLDVGTRYCPIILINAIMSDKSYNRWMGYRKMAKYCFGKFLNILCQSSRDAVKYSMLINGRESNESVINVGNLKFAAPKPLVDASNLDSFAETCKGRTIILAASTHSGDEDLMCQMHLALKKQYQDLLTIIVPRHPLRATSIKQTINSYKMSCALRSNGEGVNEKTDIYLADTMGELGLFFSLAKVTVIGGSFKNGGHNPIEPAFFDTHIIFGPDMNNFKDVAKEFLENNAATQISDLGELVDVTARLLKEKPSSNGLAIIANHDKIMSNYIDILTSYLP